MKLKDILPAFNVLSTLVQLDKENKLVLSTATRIKIAGCVRRLKPHAVEFFTQKDELIKALGTESKTKKGEFTINPGDENWASYEKQLVDALEVDETDVTVISLTKAEVFGSDTLPPEKQNQIPMDLINQLQDIKVLPENLE